MTLKASFLSISASHLTKKPSNESNMNIFLPHYRWISGTPTEVITNRHKYTTKHREEHIVLSKNNKKFQHRLTTLQLEVPHNTLTNNCHSVWLTQKKLRV
jgi:hypothetical protein